MSKSKRDLRKTKMPGNWVRLGRPERERRRFAFSNETASFPSVEIFDRRSLWNVFGSNINVIEHDLNFRIRDHIRSLFSNNSRVVNVLDLGCGKGVALNDLKRLFGDRVRTFGQVAAVSPSEKYEGVDRLLVGSLTLPDKPLRLVRVNMGMNVELDKNMVFRARPIMDLIYSYFGTSYHSFLKLTVLEEVIKWLRPGGIAVIQFDCFSPNSLKFNDDVRFKNEIALLLRQYRINNFEFKRTGSDLWPTVLFFQKPVVKL